MTMWRKKTAIQGSLGRLSLSSLLFLELMRCSNLVFTMTLLFSHVVRVSVCLLSWLRTHDATGGTEYQQVEYG